MKVLVTGVKGQLGYDIVKECEKRDIQAIGVDIDEMDITNASQVQDIIISSKVDVVIHCAAQTPVDKAEDEADMCRKVNYEGIKNIANVCKLLNIPMMYFSTDYVFNGEGDIPWHEYDKRDPLNVYGQTKYEGELEIENLQNTLLYVFHGYLVSMEITLLKQC